MQSVSFEYQLDVPPWRRVRIRVLLQLGLQAALGKRPVRTFKQTKLDSGWTNNGKLLYPHRDLLHSILDQAVAPEGHITADWMQYTGLQKDFPDVDLLM